MAIDAQPILISSLITNAPGTAGTTISVSVGDGAKYAAFPFNALVWPQHTEATNANSEIVRITGRATDDLTVTRAQEGTTALNIDSTYQIAIVYTPYVLSQYAMPGGGSDGQVIKYATASSHPQKLSWATAGLPPGWYDVTNYGAVGDGTTDDTDAIQSAIDAAATAGGGIVFFPGKTFAIGAGTADHLDLTLKDNVILMGVGYFSVIKQMTTNANAVLVGQQTAASGHYNKRFGIEKLHFISGVAFSGAGGNRAGIAISIGGAREWYISTIWIDGGFTGSDQQGHRWKGGIWVDDGASPTYMGSRHSVVEHFWIQSIADTVGDAGIKWRATQWGHYWHDGVVQTEADSEMNQYTVHGYAGLLDYQMDGTHMSKVEFIAEQFPIIIDPTQTAAALSKFVSNQKFESISAENPQTTNGAAVTVLGAANYGVVAIAWLGCNFYGSNSAGSYGLDIDGAYQDMTFNGCFFTNQGSVNGSAIVRNSYASTIGPRFNNCTFWDQATTANAGIYLTDDAMCTVTGSTFRQLATGVRLFGNAGHLNTNVVVTGCDFHDNVTTPISFRFGASAQETTNIFEGNTPASANQYKAVRDLQANSQSVNGQPVFRILSDVSGADDVVEYVFQTRNAYTGVSTAQTVFSFATASGNMYMVEVDLIAVKTNGTKDVGNWKIVGTFANPAGSLALIGSATSVHLQRGAGVSAWAAALTLSGTNIIVTFTPTASDNETVHATVRLKTVSS